MTDRVTEHLALFNEAVRSGDFGPFVATFAPDAEMRFVGVPAGPFAGRDQIAQAYARQPPTDTMTVLSVAADGDTDVVRFAWDAGGTGTMTVRWQGPLVADLTVAFDG
ncbi:MAG TPA: nuclear transport factor 2 family protein [Pilimelia sp.]|nr:nuclear transport factor 2 family protein [Pilimelia sp.]